ncbi:MAG: Asp-tRNA(Asn)/Glu-tRNA(Gln) amidotransferase subunit GatC [Patescibacteria group bacterium]
MTINVAHIAKLANLPLKDEEIPLFEKQLSSVLTYINQLKNLNTENVAETSQTTGLENVSRTDETTPCLSQEDALSNTKNKKNDMFLVKGVLHSE